MNQSEGGGDTGRERSLSEGGDTGRKMSQSEGGGEEGEESE